MGGSLIPSAPKGPVGSTVSSSTVSTFAVSSAVGILQSRKSEVRHVPLPLGEASLSPPLGRHRVDCLPRSRTDTARTTFKDGIDVSDDVKTRLLETSTRNVGTTTAMIIDATKYLEPPFHALSIVPQVAVEKLKIEEYLS